MPYLITLFSLFQIGLAGSATGFVSDAVTLVLKFLIWTFGISLIGIVAYQLFNGKINTYGLLLDTDSPKLEFSPARLQALVITIGAAIYYLFLVLTNENPGAFPDIPNDLFLLLGGSHLVFIGGKLLTLLKVKFNLNRLPF